MNNRSFVPSNITLCKFLLLLFFSCGLLFTAFAGDSDFSSGYNRKKGLPISLHRDFNESLSRTPLLIGRGTYFGPAFLADTTDDTSSGCGDSTSSGCGDSLASGCGDSVSSGCGDSVSSGCGDSLPDADGELAVEILFNYLLFPYLTARAIAAHEQHEELQGDVRGSVIRNKPRNWTIFGFSATFSLGIYTTLATLGGYFPLVGVVGFSAYSGLFFIHFLVSASLYGDSQANWSRYDTYYNRSTGYYFVASSSSLGTTLASLFIYIGLYIARKNMDHKRKEFDEGDDDRVERDKTRVEFAPEILGVKVHFSPYLFCRRKKAAFPQ